MHVKLPYASVRSCIVASGEILKCLRSENFVQGRVDQELQLRPLELFCIWGWDEWYSAHLAYMKPWVLSPQLHKNSFMETWKTRKTLKDEKMTNPNEVYDEYLYFSSKNLRIMCSQI